MGARLGWLLLPVVFVACGKSHSSPTTPTSTACSYSVAAPTTSFGADGGSGSATVTTTNACAWTAASDAGWVQVSSESHTGSGTVSFTVAASTDASPRTAALTIAAQKISIAQDAVVPPAPCDFTLAAQPANLDLEGGSGQLTIGTRAGCAWTLTSDATWASVDGPAQGTGPAAVKFSWSLNDFASARAVTFSIASVTARASQPGQESCSYRVSPVIASLPRAAWNGIIDVSTARGCRWTLSVDAGWLHTGTAGGVGTGQVRYTSDFNPAGVHTTPRAATVAIRWTAPTAGQNVHISQWPDCTATPYPSTVDPLPEGAAFTNGVLTAGAAGGRVHLTALVEPPLGGCTWMVDTADSWVSWDFPKTFPFVASGDTDIHFTLPPNTTGQQRRATLMLDMRPLTIIQNSR